MDKTYNMAQIWLTFMAHLFILAHLAHFEPDGWLAGSLVSWLVCWLVGWLTGCIHMYLSPKQPIKMLY
jgi:hypothetical protein